MVSPHPRPSFKITSILRGFFIYDDGPFVLISQILEISVIGGYVQIFFISTCAKFHIVSYIQVQFSWIFTNFVSLRFSQSSLDALLRKLLTDDSAPPTEEVVTVRYGEKPVSPSSRYLHKLRILASFLNDLCNPLYQSSVAREFYS